MPRDPVSSKLFEKIASHSKMKGKNPQSIRNAISKIRQDLGVTGNIAAFEYARQHGIKTFRYIKEAKDRESLRNLRSSSHPILKQGSQRSIKKIKSKKLELPFGNDFIDDANKNSDVYPYIFILENSLRKLILERLHNENDWWNNKKLVKDDTRKYAEFIQKAEKSHKWIDKRGDHPIYYVGLEHLLKIIEMGFNPHFNDIFELEKLRTWIGECIPIRNLLAHNIKTQKHDRENVKIRVIYICKLIENAGTN